MVQAKKWLRIASIIHLINAFIWFNGFGIVPLVFYFIFLYLSDLEDEKLSDRQTFILILAIIHAVLGFVLGAIPLFIVYGEISKYRQNSINGPPKKRIVRVDPEVKKIDILLKLGVAMVLVAGILFSTTSWRFVSDFVKTISLLLFGCLLLGLSYFGEKKLKLYRASYVYFILSVVFFLLSVIAGFSFGIYGEVLSYSGEANYLAWCLTFFAVAGLSIATYLKYPNSYTLYVGFSGVLATIVSLMLYVHIVDVEIIAIVSLLILSIIILYGKESKIFQYAITIVYLLFAVIVSRVSSDNTLFLFISCIINAGIHLYFIITDKIDIEKYFSFIVLYLLLWIGLGCLSISMDYKVLIFSFLIAFLALALKYIHLKISPSYLEVNTVLYTISNIIIFIFYFFNDKSFVLISSLVFLIVILLLREKILSQEKIVIASYIEPIAVVLSIASIFKLDFLSNVSFALGVGIISCICSIIHYFTRGSSREKLYYIFSYITVLIGFLVNYEEVIPAIIFMIVCGYLFAIQYFNKESSKKGLLIFTYILFLLTIHKNIVGINDFHMLKPLDAIFTILIYVLFILFLKESTYKKITFFAILLPSFSIIHYFEYEVWSSILTSFMILYFFSLIIIFFCRKDDEKNVCGLAGLFFSLLVVFFHNHFIVGIYVGILGILAIFLSYYRREFKYFFYAGIVITIINVLYRLKGIWGSIPLWLYLLLGGFSLIGFVTYKELNKKK